MPRVAVSPDGIAGILYYHDDGTQEQPGNVSARYVQSLDGGATWSAPLPVSPGFDPSTMLHQTVGVFIGDYVGLAFDADGFAHAAWADGRSARSDVYFATGPALTAPRRGRAKRGPFIGQAVIRGSGPHGEGAIPFP